MCKRAHRLHRQMGGGPITEMGDRRKRGWRRPFSEIAYAAHLHWPKSNEVQSWVPAYQPGGRKRSDYRRRRGRGMDSLRVAAVPDQLRPAACCRCHEDGHWDQIAGKAYCPNCQELLARGEAEPLVERTQKNRRAVCSQPR